MIGDEPSSRLVAQMTSTTRSHALVAALAVCSLAVLMHGNLAFAVLSRPPVVSSAPDHVATQTVNVDQIALGDSFASGEGTPKDNRWLDISDTHPLVSPVGYVPPGDPDLCHRSANAYGLQLAPAPWTVSFHACSGATIDDYKHASKKNKLEPPQRVWIEHATSRLKLVTATFGGNDVGFSDIVMTCVMQSDAACSKKIQSRSKQVSSLASVLRPLYRDILNTAVGVRAHVRVLVLGYPLMFPTDPPSRCGLGLKAVSQISRKNMRALNAFVSDTNDQIRRSASDAQVEYVDVQNAFEPSKTEDHGLCPNSTSSRDPHHERWVNRAIPSDAQQSMHPRAKGQQAFADRVSECLKSCGETSVPTPIGPPAVGPGPLAPPAAPVVQPGPPAPPANRVPVITGGIPASGAIVGSTTPRLDVVAHDDDGEPIQHAYHLTGPSTDLSSGWVDGAWTVPEHRLDPGTRYDWTVTVRDPRAAAATRTSWLRIAMLPTATELVSVSTRDGYWQVASDGGVFSYGSAQFYGSVPGLGIHLTNIMGMARTPDDKGYWLVGSDGGVFAFGDAPFAGSLPGLNIHVNNIVGMSPTKDGQGYWLVGSDGGVFSFGTAQFYGSMGGQPLNAPVARMAPTASGNGYWLVARDGGVFSFGDAPFYGSMGGQHLNAPIIDIDVAPDGSGYWLTAEDGGVFTYGTAQYFGSLADLHLNGNITSMSLSADAGGYWLNGCDGGIFAFGNAAFYGSNPTYHCSGT